MANARLERIAFLLILAVAVWVRVPGLGRAGLWIDEDLTRLSVDGVLEEGVPRHPSGGVYLRAPFYTYAVAGSAALLGNDARVRNLDARSAVQAAAARLGAPTRLRQLEAVCDTIDALGRNANRMLALETMLLTLRETERGTPPRSWTSTS